MVCGSSIVDSNDGLPGIQIICNTSADQTTGVKACVLLLDLLHPLGLIDSESAVFFLPAVIGDIADPRLAAASLDAHALAAIDFDCAENPNDLLRAESLPCHGLPPPDPSILTMEPDRF